MRPDFEALLPVLASELPEGLRVDCARSDLRLIVAKSQEQVAIHEHATKAATEVLCTAIATEVPNRDKIAELAELYEKPDTDKKLTAGEAARQMVAPKQPAGTGVSDKAITRDVLSVLHPDRAVGGTPVTKESEIIFRCVTEAMQNEDRTLAQGLYASTVAARATAVDQPTAASLELARYKAWLALKAGKGRFETKEEVDVWKEREIKLLPVKLRVGLLNSVRNLFGQALGAGADGSIALPSEYYYDIVAGLNGSAKVIKRVMGDDVTTAEMANVDTELFDQKMTALVDQLGVLSRSQQGMSQTWTYSKWQHAITFARDLAEVAKVLSVQSPEERIAKIRLSLGGLALEFSDVRRPSSNNEEKTDGIFPNGWRPGKDLLNENRQSWLADDREEYYNNRNKY